jgi:hypothetical protein
MLMVRKFCMTVVLGCLGMLACPTASAQFSSLVSRVPDGANTVIFIDVDKIVASPIGIAENFKQKHKEMFESGLLMVPPEATQFIAAAKLDLTTMTPDWEVSIMKLSYEADMAQVATRFQGTVDNISGRQIAVLPGSVYAIRFADNIAAVGAPANRQDVGRWINRYDNDALDGLPPYLKEAQRLAETASPVIMALDLNHAVPDSFIREALEKSPTAKEAKWDIDLLTPKLASIRGVSLAVKYTDKRYAAVRVEFNEDVSMLGNFAKPMLLEALAKQGAMIGEFDDWEVKVDGRAVQITGELQESGTRRIMSMLDMPVQLKEAREQAAKFADDPQQKQQLLVQSTKQYYRAIDGMLEDLRRHKAERKTMGQISVWFGNYARKIDRLPMLNVDEEMLGFGEFVSESLRGGQADVTSAAAKSRIRQMEVPEQYDTYSWSSPIGVTRFGAYGWGGWRNVPNVRRESQMRARVRTQQRLEGNMSANQVLSEIDKASAQIRRDMTQKYNENF